MKKDPNFPHVGEGRPETSGGPPPPMPDQLPQDADPSSVKGMKDEGRLAPQAGGPTPGTVEHEQAQADALVVTPAPVVTAAAPAPGGAYRALSGLALGDAAGNRREVAGDALFDASAEELQGLLEGRDYVKADR